MTTRAPQPGPADGDGRGECGVDVDDLVALGHPEHVAGVAQRATDVSRGHLAAFGCAEMGHVEEGDVVELAELTLLEGVEEGRDPAPVRIALADQQHLAHPRTPLASAAYCR
jgi:hypothetical protein